MENEIRKKKNIFHAVDPCHHGVARPQVADRGKTSDM